jgi:hypothetical protein
MVLSPSEKNRSQEPGTRKKERIDFDRFILNSGFWLLDTQLIAAGKPLPQF